MCPCNLPLERMRQACKHLCVCVGMPVSVSFHLSLQYGHCLGQRVKLCVTGRCQVMTKRSCSRRSDELAEMEVVAVVVIVMAFLLKVKLATSLIQKELQVQLRDHDNMGVVKKRQ